MHAHRILTAAGLALALLSQGTPAAAEPAAATQSANSPTAHPYAVLVADAAHRFGIPEAWIWAVMRVESGGDAHAVSHAGAMGLMQIMPGTWALLRARHGLGTDPFDVRDNIMAGAAYLRAMFDRYGDVNAMLAAYNAGPGRYDQYLSRGRPLPTETRAYLARIAPTMDGAAGVQLAAATLPADPLAWRRAELFVQTARAGDTSASSPDGTDGDTIAAAPEPPHPLFVRRVSAARPQ